MHVNVCISRCLKEELAWTIDKQFWDINDTMLLKQLHHYKTKEKAVLN